MVRFLLLASPAAVAVTWASASAATPIFPQGPAILEALMSRLLIVGILIILMGPLYAEGQQPNTAKLKADTQKVVRIISGDKAKTQTYCQIVDLGEQIDREKDGKKAEALFQKMNELEKQLGPEYLALIEATKDVDPNSKDGQDIVSMFDELDESCPD
jgi:hypothetical protein